MNIVVLHLGSIKIFCSSQCLWRKINIVCINFGIGEYCCIAVKGGGLTLPAVRQAPGRYMRNGD
jgi:hypothetical protein